MAIKQRKDVFSKSCVCGKSCVLRTFSPYRILTESILRSYSTTWKASKSGHEVSHGIIKQISLTSEAHTSTNVSLYKFPWDIYDLLYIVIASEERIYTAI